MRQRICLCGHSSERHAPDCDVCGYHVCANFTKGCLGCLTDGRAHTCGYEPAPAIPKSWRDHEGGA